MRKLRQHWTKKEKNDIEMPDDFLKIRPDIASVEKKTKDAQTAAAVKAIAHETDVDAGSFIPPAQKWAHDHSLEELENIEKELDISRHEVEMRSTAIAARREAKA